MSSLQPKAKWLIETSAVLPATGFSNQPHNDYFQSLAEGKQLFSSVYVRMEVIRKWVCEAIAFAEMVDQCSTVSDAFNYWSQEYGRRPKIGLEIAGWLMREKGELSNTETHKFAIEVVQMALDLLMTFDYEMPGRTTNSCGCQIGGGQVKLDYRFLLKDSSEFRKRFLTNIMNCEVNDFLHPKHPHGRLEKLRTCSRVAEDRKISSALEEAAKIEMITCSDCKKIGDQIIALEQPGRATLIHTDRSFDKLCDCTQREHFKIRSAASFRPRPVPHTPPPTLIPPATP